MIRTEPFYIVVGHIEPGLGGMRRENIITVFHDREIDARAEAARLASKEKRPFYVMRACASVQPLDAPVDWTEFDGDAETPNPHPLGGFG